MKSYLSVLILGILFLSCKNTESKKMDTQLNYPNTKKVDTVTDYFGIKVKDPYSWLEDDQSAETEKWVNEENELTQSYLAKIPFRNELKNRLEILWNYEKFSAPFIQGEYTYYYKNNGLQNQYVLYRFKNNEDSEVFLDPNNFSKDGTTSLDVVSFSKNSKLVAYSISEGGSDWRKVIVMDVLSKKIVEDTIKGVKFSNISWDGESGFFYSSYKKPTGSELTAKTDQHRLYFHKLGTSQKEDILIFGEQQKRRYVSSYVTEDGHFLAITASNTTSRNELYIKDLTTPNSLIIPVITNFDSNTYLLDSHNNTLFFVTDLNAPNKRVVKVNANKPTAENWVTVISETENVIHPTISSGYIFANYMVNAISQVKQFDYNGKLIREISLPGVGTASGFGGKKDYKTVYFSFENYKTPNAIYALNPKTGEVSLYKKPSIDFNSDNYISEQVFYYSKDSTKIPMIITYKKGTVLNGKNPTILYGYGGFNISITPAFSVVTAVWLEQGGIYAVPNIRGGGEYGEGWHNAGIKMNKQNVFDDFIAAAEYLIKKSYTSPDFLAIMGRSNGGLLVGATMTQRPDLVRVALPGVGVLDMLRYHKFTAGAGWAYDYGTSEDSKEMFYYLKSYSPLHNVQKGVHYPATFITTGDHDDRVVPAHSFKFAAELQAKQGGNNPILIRIETNAGHGAGTPVTKLINQFTDMFSFTLYNMGLKEKN